MDDAPVLPVLPVLAELDAPELELPVSPTGGSGFSVQTTGMPDASVQFPLNVGSGDTTGGTVVGTHVHEASHVSPS